MRRLPYKLTSNKETSTLRLNQIILGPKKKIILFEERGIKRTKRRPNLISLQVVHQSVDNSFNIGTTSITRGISRNIMQYNPYILNVKSMKLLDDKYVENKPYRGCMIWYLVSDKLSD